MTAALTVAVRLAGAFALGGLVLPGGAGRLSAGAGVALVVAAPLARVAWLGAGWWRHGDHRFAAAAAGLLAVVGVGSLLSVLT